MRGISLSIVFLWIHLFDGNAQSFLSGYALKDLSITQWTAEEGLSSNNTTSVFQSSDGLLWITSFNGFMTFDGERFETYDRNNLSFLETDGFYAVIENTDGSILIGSQGSGLIKYKLGEFSNYQPRQGTVPKSIRSLLRLKNGDVIIGSNNGGLFHLRNDTIKNVYHEQLQGATVMALVEDPSGKIWIGTDGNGLFSWDTRTQPQLFKTEGVFSKNVEALALSSKGILFIGTTKGLISIELINNQLKSHSDLDDNSINSLWIDETFTIWIGTERRLIRYNEKLPTPDVLQSKNQIDFVRITKIANDLEGNLWITSNRSGLIRLKETNITNIQIPTISSNRVNIVHETKDGRLYVGTDANQLDICENNKCQTILLKTSIGGNGIRDIFEESENSLWLATYSGIVHIQDGKEIVYSMAEGMPANDFRTVTKDRQGNFWFGSRSGGLVKFKNGRILNVYRQNSGLESNYILAVTEMLNGDIYVGTHSGGMTVISQNGETKTYHLRKDDAGILLFNIDQDQQGKIWVMANTGPIQFTGDSLRSIALHTDRKSKTYFDWVDDEAGSAWITTSSGVLQINKKTLVEHLEQNKGDIPFQLLDDKDGMNNRECTGATRSIRSTSGKIYIPTLGGICVIDPAQRKENDVIPTIRISHFLTDTIENNPFALGKKIAAGTIRYSFHFSALSFSAPERNHFRYKLVGLDKEWSPIVNEGQVEYTNLPPGNYTFHVIGSNDNNKWNQTGTSLSFSVEPFFYQTSWFYLILVVFSIGLLYSLYKWRISIVRQQNDALKKVNVELDRFVYSASHDLRSPLASILGLINVARQDASGDKMAYMNMIEKSVLKLDSFISDIIDFSRNARIEIVTEQIDFNALLKDVFDDLLFLENYKKIERIINIKSVKSFHSDKKRLRVVLSNILANAIKHHYPEQRDNPSIEIEIVDTTNGILIRIMDNGPGIEEKYLKDIFKMFFRATSRTSGSGLGLYIVQETVAKLKGSIDVVSKLGEGTTFTVRIPNVLHM